MNGNTKLFVVSAIALSFLGPAFAHAATTVYFKAPTTTITAGVPFSVKLLVDSDQPVNAYAINFGFPPGMVEFLAANNANSIITVWQNSATVTQNGEVAFKGGSLAPFSGVGGELLTVNFLPLASGTATLSFHTPAIYLANGKGTKIIPATTPLSLKIISGASSANAAAASTAWQSNDAAPPEITFLSIIDDPVSPNQKLLGFFVNDSGTGIKSAEMRYRSRIFLSDWQTVRNPSPLAKDVWQVDFRATDNAGNTVERTIYDRGAFAAFIGWVAMVVILLAVIIFFLVRRKR